jgi:DNA replication and repair protein RecF
LPTESQKSCWISSLALFNFRSYDHLSLEIESPSPIVITGPNGTGKTNLLEAISLLGPSKGLRHAKLASIQNFSNSYQPWALHAKFIYDQNDVNKLVVAQDPEKLVKKTIMLNGTPTSQSGLFQWLTILWLTPFMDQIFLESTSLKRKFLDRLICALHPNHQTHLAKLEYALKERSKLLKDNVIDAHWYKILEERIARESVAIISQRQEYIHSLNTELCARRTPFPIPSCTLKGPIEEWLKTLPALEVEEKIITSLNSQRDNDLKSKLNSLGAHQSEFCVNHLDFQRPAEVCSTGEQKALLLSMLLAHARLSSRQRKRMPIMLLDEVVAHLDSQRREKLFIEICELNMQTWLTGTDDHLFAPLAGKAQFFSVQSMS